ncbi:unnamed protein product [Tuwongella immobilis]|uniref:Uncharacterized protein n=2 Tax=Tuwongella immobilis TaxID=692036 RepID=A0A6C2YLS5_9BACT|nr:unnamed protein product [Tuwongella immobilis]VTS00222.1 unnamed protein product [Tuwongella immobilis]
MAEARKLLEKIDASWTAHHSRIDEKCRLFITQNSSFSKANIMSQSSLIFLSQLLLATKNGSIRWSYNELNPNSFYTEFMNHAIVIDLLQPIDSHETPLGNLVAKVTLPGATIAFACGTDGFFTIEEILASSFPEFHHRFERTMNEYQSAIDALTKLIH